MINIDEMASRAKQWAVEAGRLSMDRAKQPLEVSYKSSPSDLVTIVDKEIEEFMIDRILAHYPAHGIVGEEGMFEREPRDFDTLWIIDPIDGTMNFVHQKINYVVSVAVVHKGMGILGVIYDPSRDELFYAQRGKGSFLNEQPLQIRTPVMLPEALLCTSLFWNQKAEQLGLDKIIYELPKRSRGIRIYGCAALEMAYVAAGRIDAYISLSLNPWDYAAGKIILEEAGGKATTIDGSVLGFDQASTVLACNPHLHSELVAWINR